MTTTAGIELVKVTKRYGSVTAVDAIDLRIPAGAYCCLIGPSGCGKTSTLRMIAGHEAASAGDILRGLELGLSAFKFFPAETSGGAPALKALEGPFGDVHFCPTGGVSLANAPTYFALKSVLCVGGSWITPKSSVEAKDWATVERLAQEAAQLST